jgi:hypothetical protein
MDGGSVSPTETVVGWRDDIAVFPVYGEPAEPLDTIAQAGQLARPSAHAMARLLSSNLAVIAGFGIAGITACRIWMACPQYRNSR